MTSLTSLTSPPTIPCPRLPLLWLQRCPSQASTWGPSCWQFPAPGYKPSHPPHITTWLSPGPPFNCHPSTEAFTDHTAENGNPAYTLVFLFLPAGWLICFYTAYISICHMMYSIILLTAFYPRLQHKVNEKDLYLFWSVQDRQSSVLITVAFVSKFWNWKMCVSSNLIFLFQDCLAILDLFQFHINFNISFYNSAIDASGILIEIALNL